MSSTRFHRRDIWLWIASALGPTAWFLLLSAGWYAVPGSHEYGRVGTLRMMALIAALFPIVAGVLAAYDRIPQFGYRVWNLGGSHPVALDTMVETIAGVVGKPARVVRGPMRPGDVQRTWADLTRSGAELAYAPRTPFEEGVRRQWEWMRGQL